MVWYIPSGCLFLINTSRLRDIMFLLRLRTGCDRYPQWFVLSYLGIHGIKIPPGEIFHLKT